MGGVHLPRLLDTQVALPIGSSPRGRGTQAAYDRSAEHRSALHRVGGERTRGSSPRGRGTLAAFGGQDAAYAGAPLERQTSLRSSGQRRWWCSRRRLGGSEHKGIYQQLPVGPPRNSGCQPVHPRVGGEHWVEVRTRGFRRHAAAKLVLVFVVPGETLRAPIHPSAWVGWPQRSLPDRRPPASAAPCSHAGIYLGSSPRGRGTLLFRIPRARPDRRAVHPRVGGDDKTSRHARPDEGEKRTNEILVDGPASPPMPWRALHPRVGGEHFFSWAALSAASGSSPRGRGTRALALLTVLLLRFIPAWAGNTREAAGGCSLQSVHPRVGGEHNHSDSASLSRHRFIPAWAGNTGLSLLGQFPNRFSVGGDLEPPPIVLLRIRFIAWAGNERPFIPAWAGNTSFSPSSGSSRGRGTPEKLLPAIGRRFIPAWAGNTSCGSARNGSTAVHPRVGGEHPWVGFGHTIGAGSSPRGRGTPRSLGSPRVGHYVGRRFIPAWADRFGSSPRGRGTLFSHPADLKEVLDCQRAYQPEAA